MQATDHVTEDDPDLFLDDEEASVAGGTSVDDQPPWRILIVDDDVDVHVVTKFALSSTNFQGRRLSFFHAYSAAEALNKLRDTPDIALVLLDVMMETADAGLRFARQVRDDLHNDLVRIVLRTGQPGQALEHSIIVDYDVNDFWSKTDLTTRKLFTTVIASLRAYATLAAAAKARDAADAQLQRAQQVMAAVDRHALVLTLDRDGRIVEPNARFCDTVGMKPEQLRGRDLHAVHREPFPADLAAAITTALSRDGAWDGELHTTLAAGASHLRCSVLAFKDADGAVQQYVAVATPLA
ncbi:MAG TPA: PAS domain-containing protein [Telluria sp.]|nr:PAS domain-containing protein [Telluria sp.]